MKNHESSIIEVAGQEFEYLLLGTGPRVIFLNGFRMPFSSWDKVYPQVAEHNQVLLINRPGVGKSAKARVPQTANQVVSDLNAVLHALDLQPPYIFVAHSLGGLFANFYARLNPEYVGGVVLVDAPHPDEIAEQKKHSPPLLLDIFNRGLTWLEKLGNPYKYSEDERVFESLAQLKSAARFPEIPLAVVTGTQKLPFVPQAAFDLHLDYQKRLVELSPTVVAYNCDRSGHFPQITEPQIIILAIDNILRLSQSRKTS